MNAAQLAAVVSRYRYLTNNEGHLQDGLARALDLEGIPYAREAVIAAGCRIDFLVARVGVEVKVNGSTTEVERQLRRYLASPLVDELVLVTTRARHAHDFAAAALPVVVVSVGSPW
jgi:hypothetical protein